MWSAMGMDPETAERPRAAPATVPARARKRSRTALARSILRQVRAHPANAAAPNRAVLRTCVWQLRKRLTRRPIARRAYGLDLSFPHRSGSLSNLVYFGECFEWENINFLRRYLRPGDTVVDAGANVGMFTYAAAEAVAPDGRVHVFEPLAWAAEAITANIERNRLGGRVTLYPIAVADRAGTVRFASDLDVSSHIEFVAGSSFNKQSTEVPTDTLDATLPAGPIALAKIDVEGAELLALQGFREHLAAGNPPVVMIEAHNGTLKKMGSSRVEVLELLRDLGYEMHLFDVATSSLQPVPKRSNEDVFAVRTADLPMVLDRLARR
jgi:FkbM family methyltransferase